MLLGGSLFQEFFGTVTTSMGHVLQILLLAKMSKISVVQEYMLKNKVTVNVLYVTEKAKAIVANLVCVNPAMKSPVPTNSLCFKIYMTKMMNN